MMCDVKGTNTALHLGSTKLFRLFCKTKKNTKST